MTEMDSDEFDQLQNRLLAYYETGRLADGERVVRQALTGHPDDPDALGWLASFLGAQDRIAEAGEVIDRALRLRPEDDRLLWIKSSLRFLDGDHEQALAASRAALELDPEDVDNLFKQAGLLIIDGEIDEGRRLLHRALELDPDNPELHQALAACHMRDHDWPAAEDAFAAALRIRPDDRDSLHGIGVVRMVLNKVKPSLAAFTAAVQADPSGNSAYYLAWPITHAHYRSRWIQPLIALLLVCVPIAGPAGTALRVAAGLLLVAAVVDACVWLVSGGGVSWRALRRRSGGQRTVTALAFTILCAVFALLGIAVATGSTAAAWWSLAPFTALWMLNLLDSALEPEEDGEEQAGVLVQMLASVEYTIGFDLKGLRRRLRAIKR